jgi:hypothetical protein
MSENGRRVIAAVREVAAERPNHVHVGSCLYVFDTKDAPGCLVGHGLWRVGLIDRAWVRKHPTYNADAIDHLRIFAMDNDEVHWLRIVQVRQDHHHTWKVAVEWADLWAETNAPELLTESVMA